MFDPLLKLRETFFTAQEDKRQNTKPKYKDKIQRQNTKTKYKDKVNRQNTKFTFLTCSTRCSNFERLSPLLKKTKDKLQRQKTKYKDKIQTRNTKTKYKLEIYLSHMFDSLLKLRETFFHCQQSFQPICLRILPTFYERFNQHLSQDPANILWKIQSTFLGFRSEKWKDKERPVQSAGATSQGLVSVEQNKLYQVSY